MSDKFHQEIEDILRQAGPVSDRASRRSGRGLRWVGGGLRRLLGGPLWAISPVRVFLVGVALLLSALLVRGNAPGFTGPLAWAGLLVLIAAYAMFFTRSTPKLEKRWRGTVIETQKAPDWRRRVRGWFRR